MKEGRAPFPPHLLQGRDKQTFHLSPWLYRQGRDQGQLNLCTAGAGDSTAGPSAEQLRHVTGLG